MLKKITLKSYKKSIAEIQDILYKDLSPLGLKGKEKRTEKAKNDFWFFVQHYLPHYFSNTPAEFHKCIINKIQSDAPNVAIAAPRGFAKSTIVTFAYPLWSIVSERHKFIIIVSATKDLADDLANFIRLELIDNERLREDFGKLLLDMGSSGNFVAKKTRIFSRGKAQAVRGFRYKESRPDLIIIDDIEKDNESLSPVSTIKTLRSITSGLLPALKPNGKFVVVGTILAKRSVAGIIFLSDDSPWNLWDRTVFRALEYDENGNPTSLWEERFSVEFLEKQKELIGITTFNQEYNNQPTDDGLAMFDLSMIIDKEYEKNAPIILFVDPSVDGLKKNDYKAAVLVSKNNNGTYTVVDGILIQGRDSIFFDAVCDLYLKYQGNIVSVLVESISFMKYFVQNLDQHAKNKEIYLNIKMTSSNLKKEYRISQLVPLFETGKIYFDPVFRTSKSGKILIEQLIYFPTLGVHDDGPDALAFAISSLQKTIRSTNEKPMVVNNVKNVVNKMLKNPSGWKF